MKSQQKKAPEDQGQTRTNRMMKSALSYAEKGVKVLPLQGKEPIGYLVPKGLLNASTDPHLIRSWWEREPEANIGVVPPEGYSVLDIDPRNGGVETIKSLVNGRRLGSLVAKTGGGGQHIWLKGTPEGIRGSLGKGVDVKKSGRGYVVAPPSIHPKTGKRYEWKKGFDLSLVCDWPGWLKAKEVKKPINEPSDLTKSQVKQILAKISAKEYEDWVTVGMALKASFGDKAFPLFVKWSQTVPDASSENECRKKWDSFKGEGVTVGSLISMAGLSHPPPPLAKEEFADEDFDLPKPKEAQPLDLIRLSEVTPTKIPWAWRGYLAYGSAHCIAGEPSAGKSTFVAGLVARITQGHHWPDGSDIEEGPQRVLMVNGEEDLRATIVPRLINCGANMDLIDVVREEKEPFSLQDDIKRTEKVLEANPSIRFLIVDPIGSYMHGRGRKEMDSWKDDHVRQVLHPWATLAQKYKVCFIFIAHFGKAKTTSAMHRIMGSQAFVALTRIALACTKATHYAGDENARAIGAVKQNLGKMRPPLLYNIQPVEGEDEAPSVEFVGPVQGIATLEDLMEYEQESKKREENPEGLPARILDVIENTPGLSMTEVAEKAGVSSTSEGYRRVLHHLIDLGMIVARQTTGPAKRLYSANDDHLIG